MDRLRRFARSLIVKSRWETTLQEWRWARRHLKGGNDWGNTELQGKKNEWVLSYWDSIKHPHRSLLINMIARHHPSSILEVGANCGPNLYLLTKKLPHTKLYGIDINPAAVKIGNKLFAKEEIPNIKLSVGKADNLNQFGNGAFDLVFTDAVLLYIGPDKIRSIAKEMLRVARKALILLEWQSMPEENDPEGLGIYYGSRWKRDYKNLFSQFVPDPRIHLTKLSYEQWPDPNWATLGYIIEITK